MLTVDFERFPVTAGSRVLDLGCGAGRHAFELYRRGAQVVAMDRDHDELRGVAETFLGLRGDAPALGAAGAVRSDALALPFPDGTFDGIIAAEILEHIWEDASAIAELVRVLRPGGRLAVTVPRWFPEMVCWALSDPYHEVEGGHVRIYRASVLGQMLTDAGVNLDGVGYAHALHSPYWWLKCAVGVDQPDHPWVSTYRRMLEWDITAAPLLTRTLDRVLNPVLGKSVVLYAHKPHALEPAPDPVGV